MSPVPIKGAGRCCITKFLTGLYILFGEELSQIFRISQRSFYKYFCMSVNKKILHINKDIKAKLSN